MIIKELHVNNFKSFQDLKVNLFDFNVLVGCNASGKSNFISIFNFLRNIASHGITNAISMQGGPEYLTNFLIGVGEPVKISITFIQHLSLLLDSNMTRGMKSKETEYTFVLKFFKRKIGYEIIEERLKLYYNIYSIEKKGNEIIEKDKLGDIQIEINRENRGFSINVSGYPERPKIIDDIIPEFRQNYLIEDKELLLYGSSLLLPTFEPAFADTGVYDFDPRLCKHASKITGKADLEEDGSNVSIVLNNILSNPENKKKLANLMRDLLPFVQNIGIEKLADKSLIFKVQEEYSGDYYLPASFLSDGTINITAIILALFFSDNRFVIFEEPERNIHPQLISKLVSLFKERSKTVQTVVTTHNPEIVKHCDINHLLFMSRDEKGFSQVKRPKDQKRVKIFLQNDLGVEDLFIQDLLGD